MKVLLSILTIVFCASAQAQSDPFTTVFWNNYQHINPAVDGLEYKHDLRISGRFRPNDWYEDRSSHVHYSTQIGENHGLGVNYSFQNRVQSVTNSIQLNYNYQIKLPNHLQRISFGISPGIHTNKWDVIFTDEQGNIIDVSHTKLFNLNAGIAYIDRDFFGGIGITHAYHNKFETADQYYPGYSLAPHYYAHLRYNMRISRTSLIAFEGMLRTDATFWAWDLNARYNYRYKLWAGAGYRYQNSLILNAGWRFTDNFSAEYGYEHFFSDLQSAIKNTHEVTLGFIIPHKRIGFSGGLSFPTPIDETIDDDDEGH